MWFFSLSNIFKFIIKILSIFKDQIIRQLLKNGLFPLEFIILFIRSWILRIFMVYCGCFMYKYISKIKHLLKFIWTKKPLQPYQAYEYLCISINTFLENLFFLSFCFPSFSCLCTEYPVSCVYILNHIKLLINQLLIVIS